jgi:hypothetical protein
LIVQELPRLIAVPSEAHKALEGLHSLLEVHRKRLGMDADLVNLNARYIDSVGHTVEEFVGLRQQVVVRT